MPHQLDPEIFAQDIDFAKGFARPAQAWADEIIALSGHNTGSRNLEGLAHFVPKLEALFTGLPAPMVRLDLTPEQVVRPDGTIEQVALGQSLLWQVRPGAPIQILLTGHYDTVFPLDSHFQTAQILDDDRLGGPGVADMKGGIMVMAHALAAFETHPQKDQIGYRVLLSPDEEIGSIGSGQYLAQYGAIADIGLTYEPALADGSMAGARKGSGNFSLHIGGRAAHVGRAHKDGRSAILAAAKAIVALEALNQQNPDITLNVGRLDGGTPVNVVPDHGLVRFNVRAPDEENMDWALAEIHKIVAIVNQEDGISAHLHGGFTRPPKPKNAAQTYLMDNVTAVAKGLGQALTFLDTGGVCEGNNLAAVGCPNIDTLGVCGAYIHSDQEYVVVSSFNQRLALSVAILSGLANGTIDAKAPRKLINKLINKPINEHRVQE